jgi:predicted patatin/cPLA2 family phospholipase
MELGSDFVCKNIQKRSNEIETNSKSDIKTALIVQGGGMRGIYSMACLNALNDLDLPNAFDHIYSASAGAMNCAYMLGKKARSGLDTYIDDLSNRKFYNKYKIIRSLNVDFLVDDIIKNRRRLDLKEIRNIRTVFHIMLTDVITAKLKTVTNQDDNVDLYEALRASAALPILYNKIVNVDGHQCVDGGLSNNTPVKLAIEDKCTDALVVLTRTPEYRCKKINRMMIPFLYPYYHKFSKDMRKVIFSEPKTYNDTMDYVHRVKDVSKEIRIKFVYPSDLSRMVSRTTISREKLLDCALMGMNDVRRLFGADQLEKGALE